MKAGLYGGGRKDVQHVTIATVQTLRRMKAEAFDDLVNRFGCVIVDEAHHIPASTFQDVLASVPALYRFGLTATPVREDGLTPLLRMTLGEKLFEIDYARLIDLGHLMEPTIEQVETRFTFPYGSADDYGAMVEHLVYDDVRNAQIAAIASEEAHAGETVLVLSDRVDHCQRLADMTGGVALTGEMKPSERDDVLTRFKLGEIKIVCATSLADEGLDVPRLSRLILAYPGKAAGRTIQRLGRVMRKGYGKSKPKVYDFVDVNQPVLRSQSLKRARIYRSLLGERIL
jgi:superfamily II DNA or RNA helicase